MYQNIPFITNEHSQWQVSLFRNTYFHTRCIEVFIVHWVNTSHIRSYYVVCFMIILFGC